MTLQSLLLRLSELAAVSPVVLLLVKISIVLAVAWLVHFSLQRANARWRVFLWRAASLALLLLPFTGSLRSPVGLEWQTVPAALTTGGLEEALAFSPDAEGIGMEPDSPPSSEHSSSSAAELPHTIVRTPLGTTSAESGLSHVFDWSILLLSVWALGVTCGLLRLAFASSRIRSLVRASQAAPTWISSKAGCLVQQLSLPRVAVRECAHLNSPVILGIGKKTILLPNAVCCNEYRREMSHILLHELAHLRGRDLGWNLTMHITSALLWFHPCVWRIRYAHMVACEQIADIEAARTVGDTEAYQRTLARIALQAAGSPISGLAMARSSSSVRRRLRVLSLTVRFAELSRSTFWLAVLTTVATVFAIGGIRVVFAEDDERWTLAFANDTEYGTVTLYDAPEISMGIPRLSAPTAIHSAKGDVQVAWDEFAVLKLNSLASEDLGVLADLPVDTVGGLTISNCELDAADFEVMGRFRGLRIPNLDECSMASDLEIEALAVAGGLQRFSFSAANEDDVEMFIR